MRWGLLGFELDPIERQRFWTIECINYGSKFHELGGSMCFSRAASYVWVRRGCWFSCCTIVVQ